MHGHGLRDLGLLRNESNLRIRATRTAIALMRDDKRNRDINICSWKWINFALQSSGAIFTMPLGPKLAMIAYDRAAYTMSSTNGVAEFRKNEEAEALNDLQILGASKNVYFSQSSGSNNLAQCLEANRTERDQPLFKNTMLIEDSKEETLSNIEPQSQTRCGKQH